MATPTTRYALARLREVIPEGSPTWEAALASLCAHVGSARNELGMLRGFFLHLGARGVTYPNARREDLEDWLSAWPAQGSRVHRVAFLRRFYREARRRGLCDRDPTDGVHSMMPQTRNEHRLSDDEVRRIIAALRARFGHYQWRLAARRDLAMLALAMCRTLTTRDVAPLRWVDVGLQTAEAPLAADLPTPVIRVLEDYRSCLSQDGVIVIPEDALFPPLGSRVRFGWLQPERDLLVGATWGGLNLELTRLFARAGVSRRAPSGCPFVSLEWFERTDLGVVADLLAEPSPAAIHQPADLLPRRIPTRWAA